MILDKYALPRRDASSSGDDGAATWLLPLDPVGGIGLDLLLTSELRVRPLPLSSRNWMTSTPAAGSNWKVGLAWPTFSPLSVDAAAAVGVAVTIGLGVAAPGIGSAVESAVRASVAATGGGTVIWAITALPLRSNGNCAPFLSPRRVRSSKTKEMVKLALFLRRRPSFVFGSIRLGLRFLSQRVKSALRLFWAANQRQTAGRQREFAQHVRRWADFGQNGSGCSDHHCTARVRLAIAPSPLDIAQPTVTASETHCPYCALQCGIVGSA